jgi:hypothetical protein
MWEISASVGFIKNIFATLHGHMNVKNRTIGKPAKHFLLSWFPLGFRTDSRATARHGVEVQNPGGSHRQKQNDAEPHNCLNFKNICMFLWVTISKEVTLCVNQAFNFPQGSSTCGRGRMKQMAHQSDATEGISWCAKVTWELPAMKFVVLFGFYRRKIFPSSKFTARSLKNSDDVIRLLQVTKWRAELYNGQTNTCVDNHSRHPSRVRKAVNAALVYCSLFGALN